MTTDPLGSFRSQLVEGVAGAAARRRRRVAVVGGAAAAVAVAAGAVVVSAGDGGDQQVKASAPTTEPPFECPVTEPPEPGFGPPAPWPERPASGAWFGSDELWTVLPVDGPRKSVWWSANFPGGGEEEQPEIAVTWHRLDDPSAEPIVDAAPGTNAYTPQDGWFMIAGMDPPKLGCWEVTATYKGAELSYVYERLPELWVSAVDGGELALLQGRVRYDEGLNCYSLEQHPVVWPRGTTVSKDGQQLTLSDGTRVRVGDHVRGAGGVAGEAAIAAHDIPPPCIPPDRQVSVLNLTQPIEVTP